MWYVYLLKCVDKSFYTGVTQDIERRIFEHNNDKKKGSKYVWSRRPAVLIYKLEVKTKSQALRKELEIKRWSRKKKIQLIGLHSSRVIEGENVVLSEFLGASPEQSDRLVLSKFLFTKGA